MLHFPFTPRTQLIRSLSRDLHEHSQRISPSSLSTIVNSAFWASMITEEGRSTRAVLALGTPQDQIRMSNTIEFADAIPLSPRSLAKLSASFPFGRGSLGVYSSEGKPSVWGFCFNPLYTTWTVEIVAPGLVAIRDDSPKLRAVVQPSGKLLHIEDPKPLADAWLDFLFSRTKFLSRTAIPRQVAFEYQAQFFGLLRVAARAMRQHGRGGTLLLGPQDGDWLASLRFGHRIERGHAFVAKRLQAFREWAAQLPRDQLIGGIFLPESKEEEDLHDALRLVAGLSAVDGALVLTYDLQLLGYGAKLVTASGVVRIREFYPLPGDVGRPIEAGALGGTRHQSAAQFVAAHSESCALVASQDGRFTVFCSDTYSRDVLALRSELLLLEDSPLHERAEYD